MCGNIGVTSPGRVGDPFGISGGVANTHVAAPFAQGMPVAGQFPLGLGIVEGEEEWDVGEASFEAVPSRGGMELEGPFRGLAGSHFTLPLMLSEVIGDGQMGSILFLRRGEEFGLDGLPQKVMTKGPQAAALNQMRLHCQQQRSPGLPIHRPLLIHE